MKMIKMRKEIYAILIVAVLLMIYFAYQSGSRESIFTKNLGDMTLTKYETGDAAASEISNIYGLADIPLGKGYYAVYTGKSGTMRIWAAEAPDHNIANDAYNNMNSKLGASTGHEGHEFSGDVGQSESHKGHNDGNVMGGKPVKVDMMDLMKPDIFMIQKDNIYSYYYFKMDYKMGRVYWITFDFADTDHQKALVKQAIMDI